MGAYNLFRELSRSGAPEYFVALLRALQLENPDLGGLARVPEGDWSGLLSWCDSHQLTLLLPEVCGDLLPTSARSYVFAARQRYAMRLDAIKTQLAELQESFKRAGLDFIYLKGFSHSPLLAGDPLTRIQSDIDVWVPGENAEAGQRILGQIGYLPLVAAKSRHLPPMVRPVEWQWTGDWFDPHLPISVEIHYELWSAKDEYIDVPGQSAFWNRRRTRNFDGLSLAVLCDTDLVAFATLHLLLHLLHGELPMQRAWEIANFLHCHEHDGEFWKLWHSSQPEGLQQVQALVFELLGIWFGCRLSAIVEVLSARQPAPVRLWIEQFCLSPLKWGFSSNKDELWLHLALIHSFWRRTKVVGRRLLPIKWERPVSTEPSKSARRMFPSVRQNGVLASRVLHHATTFVPTALGCARWLWLQKKREMRAFTKP